MKPGKTRSSAGRETRLRRPPDHFERQVQQPVKVVFATGNPGKIAEIRRILKDSGADVVSMKEAGVFTHPEENGKTFEANALIKVDAVAEALGPEADNAIVMADDSGLSVDALGGEPGVRSARYLGENTSYTIKNNAIIRRLEDVPDERRTARFVCVIAARLPGGETLTAEGTVEGKIGREIRGANGFGYDPIFYLPDMGRTTAELAPEEKDAVSHRGRALRKMKELLENRNLL